MRKRCVTISLIFVCLAALILLGMKILSDEDATIREVTEVIKTYPYSDPDPVPILIKSSMWGTGARLYPYYLFGKYSQTSIDKEWTVVHMENPYIKLSILPQVGGKVWGATEKSTNKEFIYTNHVMKFREIALRGPWTSGGIEFNFGIIGHAPSCATPVDYLLRENPDGSVSCTVGTMDLPSRTRWCVTITLPKDKAFFETQAFWYNPSALNQSYYSWMNGAINVGEDLQYIFPGNLHIGHDYSVLLKPWPTDEKERNLSWYKNNNFDSYKSYFTVGEYENFYGGYWHDSDFGFGHWALYDDMPGQKIWIWGLSRQGAIWEDLLTDSDGQYSEPQAGRYLNQSDHEFFIPYTADTWKEIWFPYKKIGPMVNASPSGVLNVTQIDDAVKVGVCALQKIDDDLVLSIDGRETYREHLLLKPMEVFEKTLPLPEGTGKLQITIAKKLCFSSDPNSNDLQRPINFHDYDENTIEGLYLSAERFHKQRNYTMALEKYLACLEKEPLHTRALCRVAELYFHRAEYDKALTYAHKALENVMYNPDANYIYGVIARHLGNMVDAKETLGWATRSMKYRSAAYCQMAEIYLLENNCDLALEYAQRAIDFNKYNMNAYQTMAVTYRLMNQSQKARQVLNQIIEIEPLNHLTRFERYLLNLNQKNLSNFQSMIRNELPHENYLEMSLHYIKLGLNGDAVKLLKLAPEYPTVYYWLAFLLQDEAPTESAMYLEKANSISPWLIFPFREESIPVFQWAMEKQPEDWKATYYLSLIYWSKGRIPEARELLDKCGNSDFAPFYLTKGHLSKEINPEKALEEFEKAVKIDPKSWRTWHHLISYLNELGMFDKSLPLARKAASKFPEDNTIRIDLIFSLMKNKFYQEALDMLENTVALPREGATNVHSMFVECQINLAMENIKDNNYSSAIKYLEGSKRYPEHLGTGKPYHPDFRMQDFLIALCYDKLGEKRKAEEIRKAMYDYTLKHWEEQTKNQYFGGLILRYFGQLEKADQLLKQEKPPQEILDIIKNLEESIN